MVKTALVTDSTADLPPALAARHGVTVVPASVALQDGIHPDGSLETAAFYRRLAAAATLPQPFAATEPAFRSAFLEALDGGAESVLCLVAPFDVSAAFSAAAAAALNLEDERPGVMIKVMNPGVASAGLCALIRALAESAADSSIENVVALVDELEPGCDTLFVPATTSWLERVGKLALIEDRLGPLNNRVPVLRVGTRITPVAAEPSQAEAVQRLLEIAGARAGRDTPVAAVVDHADTLTLAMDVATHLRNYLTVAELAITELSPAIGTLLGPGAVGVGVCPMGDSSA